MALRDNIKNDVVLEEQVNSEQQVIDDVIDTKPTSLRSQVKTSTEHINRGKAKKERFLWVKVWISYLLSLFMKDRGKIPDNIGDKIMITNNLYITKLYLSTIIQITELGTYTPVTLAFVEFNHAIIFLTILWSIAILGIVIKLCWMNAPRFISTFIYPVIRLSASA